LADRALVIWPNFGGEEPSHDEDEAPFDTAGLRKDAMDRVAFHLGGQFVKKGVTTIYVSEDANTLVACHASRRYGPATGVPEYWYSLSFNNKSLLEEAKYGFVAFACGTKEKVLLFRVDDFAPYLNDMDKTPGLKWHIFVNENSNSMFLKQAKKGTWIDVSKYLLPAADAGVPSQA
jgi:hypothetical protein